MFSVALREPQVDCESETERLVTASLDSFYDEQPSSCRFRRVLLLWLVSFLGIVGGVVLRESATKSHYRRAEGEISRLPAGVAPVGPSQNWRPRRSSCVPKASCRNWYVWSLDGRLGNRIMALSADLVQAVSLNLCFAWVQSDDIAELKQILDFPESPNGDELIDMAEPQGAAPVPVMTQHLCKGEFPFPATVLNWTFCFKSERHAADAATFKPPCGAWCTTTSASGSMGCGEVMCHSNCVTSKFDPYDIANGTQLLQDYFVSTGRLKCKDSNASKYARPELGPNGVVIHLRSGDIMQPDTPGGRDPQPPCSFYMSVLETGNNGRAYDSALLVTQPDMRNPCIDVISQKYTQVTVQSSSVFEDACTIALAKNLALASYSSFDVGLSRLNVNLQNLHIPMGQDDGVQYFTYNWPSAFVPWVVREEGMPHAQHIYTFPGYDTNWISWSDRIEKMTKYPGERIIKRTVPAIGRKWAEGPKVA